MNSSEEGGDALIMEDNDNTNKENISRVGEIFAFMVSEINDRSVQTQLIRSRDVESKYRNIVALSFLPFPDFFD